MTEARLSTKVLFITIAIIGGLLLAWVFLKQSNNLQFKVSPFQQPVMTKKYTNAKYGFEFNYPSTWQEFSSKTARASFGKGVTVAISRNKPAIIAIVRVNQAKEGASLDSLPAMLSKKMASSFDGFKEISSQFVTVGSNKALRYTYSFKSEKNIEIMQSQQIMLKGGRVYYLIFHSKPASFLSMQSEINQIADSFRVK